MQVTCLPGPGQPVRATCARRKTGSPDSSRTREQEIVAPPGDPAGNPGRVDLLSLPGTSHGVFQVSCVVDAEAEIRQRQRLPARVAQFPGQVHRTAGVRDPLGGPGRCSPGPPTGPPARPPARARAPGRPPRHGPRCNTPLRRRNHQRSERPGRASTARRTMRHWPVRRARRRRAAAGTRLPGVRAASTMAPGRSPGAARWPRRAPAPTPGPGGCWRPRRRAIAPRPVAPVPVCNPAAARSATCRACRASAAAASGSSPESASRPVP